jgi:hypothetical protein
MPSDFRPDPKLKFTFGLWTVGNIGRDPFGGPVRAQLSPVEICDLLGDVGAYGVNFHDNDLVPIDTTQTQRDRSGAPVRQQLSPRKGLCLATEGNDRTPKEPEKVASKSRGHQAQKVPKCMTNVVVPVVWLSLVANFSYAVCFRHEITAEVFGIFGVWVCANLGLTAICFGRPFSLLWSWLGWMGMKINAGGPK